MEAKGAASLAPFVCYFSQSLGTTGEWGVEVHAAFETGDLCLCSECHTLINWARSCDCLLFPTMRQGKEKVLDWVNFGAIESGIEPYSAKGLKEHYLNNSRCWDKNASRYHNNIIIPLIDYGNIPNKEESSFWYWFINFCHIKNLCFPVKLCTTLVIVNFKRQVYVKMIFGWIYMKKYSIFSNI